VEEYLRLQGRFAHLFSPRTDSEMIAEIQARVDSYWSEVV
jgi:pyruvate ferredoxin oxidoreductase beta subunit